MKVGDLVEFNKYTGLVIEASEWATLVQWLDDEEIEDVSNYSPISIRVVSESR